MRSLLINVTSLVKTPTAPAAQRLGSTLRWSPRLGRVVVAIACARLGVARLSAVGGIVSVGNVEDAKENMKKRIALLVARVGVLSLCAVLTISSRAGVITTRPDPPPTVGNYEDYLESLDIDFNQDGTVDFRLVTQSGWIIAYFDWPARVVEKPNGSPSGTTNIDFGGVGGLPLGTVIEQVLNTNLTNHIWWTGFTNRDDLTREFGNHQAGVTGGGIADATEKEGVMGVEFFINGQAHYAYIHFDFRPERVGGWYPGSGGYIYGWAYEDIPGAPITGERIRSGPPVRDFKITAMVPHVEGNGVVGLVWNAVVGETYRVQVSEDLENWTDLSGDVLANRDSMLFTTPSSTAPHRFFRIECVCPLLTPLRVESSK